MVILQILRELLTAQPRSSSATSMARRKRQFMEDDDSSGGDDSDGDFDGEDTYSNKRKRAYGKDDTVYGIFAEDSEDDDAGRGKGKRSDWTKAPVFVSKDKVDLGEEMELDEDAPEAGSADTESSSEEADEQDGVGIAESSDAMDISQEPSRVPSPRIREEEEEELAQRPRIGGIGSSSKTTKSFSTFTKGGIGSFNLEASSSQSPNLPSTESAPLPSAFGAAARAQQQRSFIRSESPASKPAAAPLPAHERVHFSKLSGFGAKMLSKMGWEAGQGLGTTGEGIVIPIESKLRPKGMGIAFKGFKEKTEQSKMEARRRGEVVSDDEDDKPRKGRKAGGAVGKEAKRSDVWKKPKKIKTKIEHKTYEQIVAEAGEEPSASGIGIIIDATGATPREITSLADVSSASWTPSTDPTRIPEVRHNLRLIAESCKSDLDGLAREAKALGERKKWVGNEDLRLRKKVEEEAECMSCFLSPVTWGLITCLQ